MTSRLRGSLDEVDATPPGRQGQGRCLVTAHACPTLGDDFCDAGALIQVYRASIDPVDAVL